MLTLEQALAWMTFIGKDRPNVDYVHPRATGTLGPFLRSIGLWGHRLMRAGSRHMRIRLRRKPDSRK